MPRSAYFFRAAILSFILAVPTFFFVANKYLENNYWTENAEIDYRRAQLISSAKKTSLIDPNITTADEAKKQGQFWITYDGPQGVALDLLHEPKLFQEVFPGYPEAMATDQDLWKSYFSRLFDQRQWLHTLNATNGDGVQIYSSWLGCFDIMKKYGADVVVIGNSETYSLLIPFELSERIRRLKIPGLGSPKILFCSMGSVPNETIGEMASFFHKNGKSIKLLIWGFSYWMANNHHPKKQYWEDAYHERLKEVDNNPIKLIDMPKKLSKTLWNSVNYWQHFLSWEKLMPLSVDNIRKLDEKEAADLYIVHAGKYLRASIARGTYESLAANLKDLRPYYFYLQNATNVDCNTTEIQNTLKNDLHAWLPVSENVLLFLTPTTPKNMDAAPKCLYPSIQKMLKTLRTKRVHVYAEPWEKWGLDYRDYIFPSRIPSVVRFDSNHLNYQGALKATAHLVDFFSQSITRQ